jgi:hypothetical protein
VVVVVAAGAAVVGGVAVEEDAVVVAVVAGRDVLVVERSGRVGEVVAVPAAVVEVPGGEVRAPDAVPPGIVELTARRSTADSRSGEGESVTSFWTVATALEAMSTETTVAPSHAAINPMRWRMTPLCSRSAAKGITRG